MLSAEMKATIETSVNAAVTAAVAPIAEALKTKATNNAPGVSAPLTPEQKAKAFAEKAERRRWKAFKKNDPYKGKGIEFSQYVFLLAKAGRMFGYNQDGRPNIDKALWLAKHDTHGKGVRPMVIEQLEDMAANKEGIFVSKALQESTLIDGGALTPDVFATDFIELLRPATVVRRSGARVVPMSGGSLTFGKQTAPAVASYVGEGQQLNATQMQTGQIQLQVKKLMAVTAISNDLLRDAVVAADMLVRDDLVKIVALAEDLAFIRGAGTLFAPKGIRNFVPANQVINALQAGSIATAAEVIQSLQSMLYILEQTNIPMVGLAWYMTPRTKWFLKTLRDSVGAFIFRPELEGNSPTLLGWPVYATTQIPQNLNELGNNNESEVYLGVTSEYLIGENTQVLVSVFPGGTYFDANGVLQSGINEDQTIINIVERHDFNMRHNTSAVVMKQTKWGA